MKILEELWYGNIDPHGRDIRKDLQMERALSLVVKNDDTLRAMLSDIQKEQYEKLHDSQSEMTDLLEWEAFAEGFRLAVKIMIDAMNTMEIPSVDDQNLYVQITSSQKNNLPQKMVVAKK